MRVRAWLGVGLALALAQAVVGGVCGNGFVETPEACDDGNRVSGDGCSAGCTPEGGFLCEAVAMSGGGSTTRCCPGRTNPVTGAVVCSCEGQASGSAAWRVSATCEAEDVDECRAGNGGCAPRAVCVNLDGRGGGPGRACLCPAGLYGDGVAACDVTRFAAVMTLGVWNLTAAAARPEAAWLEERVATFLAASYGALADVSAAYAAPARRLLQGGYDHVTVSLAAADWDAMVALAAEVNAGLVAAFLTSQAAGLYQIAVVQETTTLVRQAPSEYAFVADDAPGFLLESVAHAPGVAWAAATQLWRFVADFQAPAGRVHVLFATRNRAGAAQHDNA